MKKNLLTLLVAASVMTMVACGGNDAANNDAANNEVVNTEVSTESVVDTEVVVDTEADAATGYVMYSSIWDKVQMTFNEDGTCVFEMPEYQIAENCTWALAEGSLIVTREDGTAFVSYWAEDGVTLKLDYTAAANDQLVGQFDTTDLTFFGFDAPPVADAATGYVMYSSIWDKVQMTFAADGTCVFEMPEYQIAENCTWTYAEGVLTVTREDGAAFTSYMAEDGATLKLDYTAAANDQLVGQFDTTDLSFFN